MTRSFQHTLGCSCWLNQCRQFIPRCLPGARAPSSVVSWRRHLTCCCRAPCGAQNMSHEQAHVVLEQQGLQLALGPPLHLRPRHALRQRSIRQRPAAQDAWACLSAAQLSSASCGAWASRCGSRSRLSCAHLAGLCVSSGISGLKYSERLRRCAAIKGYGSSSCTP